MIDHLAKVQEFGIDKFLAEQISIKDSSRMKKHGHWPMPWWMLRAQQGVGVFKGDPRKWCEMHWCQDLGQ